MQLLSVEEASYTDLLGFPYEIPLSKITQIP